LGTHPKKNSDQEIGESKNERLGSKNSVIEKAKPKDKIKIDPRKPKRGEEIGRRVIIHNSFRITESERRKTQDLEMGGSPLDRGFRKMTRATCRGTERRARDASTEILFGIRRV